MQFRCRTRILFSRLTLIFCRTLSLWEVTAGIRGRSARQMRSWTRTPQVPYFSNYPLCVFFGAISLLSLYIPTLFVCALELFFCYCYIYLPSLCILWSYFFVIVILTYPLCVFSGAISLFLLYLPTLFVCSLEPFLSFRNMYVS